MLSEQLRAINIIKAGSYMIYKCECDVSRWLIPWKFTHGLGVYLKHAMRHRTRKIYRNTETGWSNTNSNIILGIGTFIILLK